MSPVYAVTHVTGIDNCSLGALVEATLKWLDAGWKLKEIHSRTGCLFCDCGVGGGSRLRQLGRGGCRMAGNPTGRRGRGSIQ